MRTVWLKGPRTFVESTDRNGKVIRRKGKNGGDVVQQEVVKVLIPKGAS